MFKKLKSQTPGTAWKPSQSSTFVTKMTTFTKLIDITHKKRQETGVVPYTMFENVKLENQIELELKFGRVYVNISHDL